jgi:hypothetical protein
MTDALENCVARKSIFFWRRVELRQARIEHVSMPKKLIELISIA